MKIKIDNLIAKTSLIWESMIDLENRLGLLLPREELIKDIKFKARKNKIKISFSEIDSLLHELLAYAFIIYPRKNYVVRTLGWMEFAREREKMGKENKFRYEKLKKELKKKRVKSIK